jgi:hypothetical protein
MASELLYVLLSSRVPIESLPAPAADAARQLREKRWSAPKLVGAALWSLHEAGAARLELRKGKSLGFMPKTQLVVHVVRPDGFHGIEGELLARAATGSSMSVEDLVKDWFGKKVSSVQAVVDERVLAHAAEAGLMTVRTEEQERGRIGGALLGKTKQATVVEPNASTLQAEADRVAAAGNAWLAFVRGGGELADELLKRVNKALSGREFDDD